MNEAISRGHLTDTRSPRQKWHDAHGARIFDRRQFVPRFLYNAVMGKCNSENQPQWKNRLRSLVALEVA